MSVVDEDIEKLSRAVLSEARGEAEEILAEARAKADGVRKLAKERAAAERKEILARAAEEAGRIRSQAIATTQLKARTLQLERREKLLEQVFKAARQQLPSVQKWGDYDQIANQLLREALTRLGTGSARVRADGATQKLLSGPALEQLAGEAKMELQMAEPLTGGIGVIVETLDGHLHYDNTLQTRLERLENSLRSPVFHTLVGEAL